MSKYLKLFLTTNQYNAYAADTANFIKPNVSLITETNTVEYNPWVETRVVAKYNVTESTMTQQIMGGTFVIGPTSYTKVTTAFTSVHVDGNEIEISDANVNYTFDTVGEHTVKYELKDPTKISSGAFNAEKSGTIINAIKAVSITIPNSVTSIGQAAFKGCSSLTSINIPNSVTSIGGAAFAQCTSLPVENSIRYADTCAVETTDKTLTSYTLKSGTRFIIESLFNGCSSLTSINIPNSVTSIGGAAFLGCTSLTNVTIPNSVTSIGQAAFQNCSGMTSCTIGSGITSISGGAFYNCSSLSEIISNAMTAPTIPTSGQPVFSVASSGTLKVPTGSTGYDAWLTKLGSGWSIQYI